MLSQAKTLSKRKVFLLYTYIMHESSEDVMPYEELPINEKVSLRQLDISDTDVLFNLVNQNREHLRHWLPWVDHTQTPSDSEAFIIENLRKRREGSTYGYGIIFDGKLVGHISLMHITDGKDPEIGYWISSEVAGRGIVKLAASALTTFGLDTLGLHKIVIKAEPDNIASNKIAEKLGYKLKAVENSEHTDRPVNVWVRLSGRTV